MIAPPPHIARVALIGITALAHNLGLVLRGYGRHQVIRVNTRIPKAVRDLFDDANNHLLNPDRETRELLQAQGPLPTVETLDRALQYSDVVLIVSMPKHAGVWLDRLEKQKEKAPLPVILVSDAALTTLELRRVLRPRAGLLLGYQAVRVRYDSIAADLITPPGPIIIQTDHHEVRALMEQVWRPVINTVPVIQEGSST